MDHLSKTISYLAMALCTVLLLSILLSCDKLNHIECKTPIPDCSCAWYNGWEIALNQEFADSRKIPREYVIATQDEYLKIMIDHSEYMITKSILKMQNP